MWVSGKPVRIMIMFYRRELRIEYTEKIITLFQQWDFNIKEIGMEEEKLSVGITFALIVNLLVLSLELK